MKYRMRGLSRSKFKKSDKQVFEPEQVSEPDKQVLEPPKSPTSLRHDSGTATEEYDEHSQLPSNPGTETPMGLVEITRKLSKYEITSVPTPTPTPSLLGLSKDLRAKILNLALPTNSHMAIPPAGALLARFREPAILQTCHLLRMEASQVYYKSNSFYVYIENFNTTALVAWLNDFPRDGPKLCMAKIKLMVSEPEIGVFWENLLEWLQRYYRWEVVGLAVTEAAFANEGTAKVQAARKLFREVDCLRNLGLGAQPEWKDVEGVLERMRMGDKALW